MQAEFDLPRIFDLYNDGVGSKSLIACEG